MIAFSPRILEHYRHPRNSGSLEAPDIRHEDVNPLCGDRVRIELTLDGGERVREARFRADSCIITAAASSILTEMVTGWTLGAIEEMTPARLLEELQAEIRPARLQCALLPLDVLKAGIASYRATKG